MMLTLACFSYLASILAGWSNDDKLVNFLLCMTLGMVLIHLLRKEQGK